MCVGTFRHLNMNNILGEKNCHQSVLVNLDGLIVVKPFFVVCHIDAIYMHYLPLTSANQNVLVIIMI